MNPSVEVRYQPRPYIICPEQRGDVGLKTTHVALLKGSFSVIPHEILSSHSENSSAFIL